MRKLDELRHAGFGEPAQLYGDLFLVAHTADVSDAPRGYCGLLRVALAWHGENRPARRTVEIVTERTSRHVTGGQRCPAHHRMIVLISMFRL